MSGLSSLSVLVVDDSESMRRVIIELLRGLGIRRITQASNGLEALHAIADHEIDIVFTDLVMPMDGLSFTRAVRASEAVPYLPIIMITSRATRRTLEDARDAGVTEFLSKPLTVRSLAHRINEVIFNPRPFIRSEDYSGPCRRRRADPAYEGVERRAPTSLSMEPFDPEDVY